MKLALLIVLLSFSSICLGQDTLPSDSTSKTSLIPQIKSEEDTTTVRNSPSPIKKYKKKQKPKVEEETIVSPKDQTESGSTGKNNIGGFLIVGLLVATIVIVVKYRSTSATPQISEDTNPKDEGPISDYISRLLLSRQNYYRNVYLKSEAWKRKRYVVLKRDNWRCVYCGGKATEVHHTRYAKRNIGKEPIEWLVSICETCHDNIHQ